MLQRIVLILLLAVFGTAIAYAQPGGRVKLTQLEQAKVGGLQNFLKGNVGVTDSLGNQRYNQYVAIRDTCISGTLINGALTTNDLYFSRFIGKCSSDTIWYVDYRGRIKLLAPFGGGGGGCDEDWLEIGNNLCPDNINDSIYKYKYASIGARYVWPRAELLVNDSSAAAYTVIQGFRNAALSLFDRENQYWSIRQQAGSSLVDYIGGGTTQWLWTEAGGNATGAGAPFDNHMAIKATLDQIQFHKYPDSRDDAGTPVNLLNTDASGNLRSDPLSSIIPAATNYEFEVANQTTNFSSGLVFLLANTPKSDRSVVVSYNGQRLRLNTDYSVVGTTLTILFADNYVTSYDANPNFEITYPY
jgi:hypothetical protein